MGMCSFLSQIVVAALSIGGMTRELFLVLWGIMLQGWLSGLVDVGGY